MNRAIEAIMKKNSGRQMTTRGALLCLSAIALFTLDGLFNGGGVTFVCTDVATGLVRALVLFAIATFLLFFYLMLIDWSCALAALPFGSCDAAIEGNVASLIRPFVENGVLPRVLLFDIGQGIALKSRVGALIRAGALIRGCRATHIEFKLSFGWTSAASAWSRSSCHAILSRIAFHMDLALAGMTVAAVVTATPLIVSVSRRFATRALVPVALTVATYICVCSQLVVQYPDSRTSRTYTRRLATLPAPGLDSDLRPGGLISLDSLGGEERDSHLG